MNLTFLKNGRNWFLMLIGIKLILIFIYLIAHLKINGQEKIALNENQFKLVTKFTNGLVYDSSQLNNRMDKIENFISSLLNEKDLNNLNIDFFEKIKFYSNSDILDFIENKEFITNSYFWFMGSKMYIEIFFWSILGVLVSLIYYVSLANKTNYDYNSDEIKYAKFDPKEIYYHVGKMFYGPTCAFIIIIGYHSINSGYGNEADISSNFGMLIFCFIAGFYSGRVMKFLDKLKDLLLPLSIDNFSDSQKETPTIKSQTLDTVQNQQTDSTTDIKVVVIQPNSDSLQNPQ